MRTLGAPPPNLTGGVRVRSLDSPWWTGVMSELLLVPGLVGQTLTIEELTQMVPPYPDGKRPRSRTVARRLASILELVSKGPNGSRGHGATYRVTAPPSIGGSIGRQDVVDVVIGSDAKWLLEQVERMTKGK